MLPLVDTWDVVLAEDAVLPVTVAEAEPPAFAAAALPKPKNAVGNPACLYKASRPGGKRPAAAAAAAAAGLDKLLNSLKIDHFSYHFTMCFLTCVSRKKVN